MVMEITGTLENWFFDADYPGLLIWGDIYNDSKKRWPDGTMIRTSLIEKIEGDTVYTLNSVYKLGKKLEIPGYKVL